MNLKCLRTIASFFTAVSLTLSAPASLWAHDSDDFQTKTPIKHVVVIFQENISFDHYFATYPYAANPAGEPTFQKKDDTPRANNLLAGGLLTENPNSAQPFRLDRSEAVTCDQGHNYGPEQKAFDHGLMDKFPENTGSGYSVSFPCYDRGLGSKIVMGYYDGNTTTALWNYAQHYAMSDNSFSTMFGPSAPGAINLVSGTTANATASKATSSISQGASAGTIIGDVRPGYDECVQTSVGLGPNTATAKFLSSTSQNVGDLLNHKGITWGWFQGGFKRTGISTATATNGYAICGIHNLGLAGDDGSTALNSSAGDYIPHHEPFMYYASTANPHHNPPTRSLIGQDENGVNHQYDFTNGPCLTATTVATGPCTAFNANNDFWNALADDHLPAVSFLKAGAFQDGHPGYSDPLDEQVLLVQTINRLMQSKEWPEMAIIIAYDDSDGWYDHAMSPIVNQSTSTDDALSAPGSCGVTPVDGQMGRCGYGPRQPLVVISPFAKQNYVDHRVTDQASILRFIEYNWDLGTIGGDSSDVKAGSLNGMFDFDDHDRADRLILDPATGLAASSGHDGDNHGDGHDGDDHGHDHNNDDN